METMLPLKIPPGLVANGTPYQQAGRWVEGDLVRFFEGTIRPIGGWSAQGLGGATIAGVPRAALSWTPEVVGAEQRPLLAVGTTAGLYVIVGSTVYDITPAGMTTNANRMWSLEAFGSYLIGIATDPTDFNSTRGPFVWMGDITSRAERIADAPVNGTAVVATDERFLFLLGGADPLGPNAVNFPTTPSTRTVFWPSQETIATWEPKSDNSAGSFPLATAGKLIAGRRSRGETLIWTTTDMYRAQFIGGEFVYRFVQGGDHCGAISMNSPVVADSTAFWMGVNGFFAYAGFAQPLPCDVHDAVFGALNRAHAHKVWGFVNPKFPEVTWFYPGGAATECDRFVTFNYVEKHWTLGTLGRTAGVSLHVPTASPMFFDASGGLFQHETGVAATPRLRSSPIELGNGDQVMRVQSVIPDEKTLGDVQLRLVTALFPNGAKTTNGPYTLAQKTDVRLTARQVEVDLQQAVAADWRVGTIRLGVIPGGSR